MDSRGSCWCGGVAVWSWDSDRVVCLDSRSHDPKATGRTKPEDVRKIYVSGPMSGIPECNYPAFHRAADLLAEVGFDVVDPANSDQTAAHYVDFLKEDIRWLLDCEGVALLHGWEFSPGSRLEVSIAGALGMPVATLDEWLDRVASA